MNKIHPEFQLNGKKYAAQQLSQWAKDKLNSNLEFETDCASFLLDWLSDSDKIQVKTSGTTGTSKNIEIAKKAMVNSAVATGDFFELKERTSALCCLPVKYIAGKMMLVRAMILGWHIDVVEPSSNPLANTVNCYDFVAMVPLQVENSINNLHKVKILLVGGAQVNFGLANELSKIQCNAYESYSMTETVTHVALKKIGEKTFKVLPNVSIAIDERNCLVIDAPLLNPEKLVTNDIVELISESEFIWKGRADNVINSGGVKLFPEQIEEKLLKKITKRFFIAGIPDDKLGERVILFIEGKEYEIAPSVFKELDKYEKPKQISFVHQFLETETGKIKRKEIVRQFLS
ncbi:AMP-binding protein [Flavobacterium sp. H122]|uniref:AMP-binding protein n=1 Tax=Flavobacterium sp. H122 TaxID=2529860 RepID=UPI0010AA4686|nr:AMP-binding protein [Flavobacterium sp. H122]